MSPRSCRSRFRGANCVCQLLPPPPTPPHKGRAIAYGKVAPILHLAGWIGSERQLSRSALDSVLFWVRFGGRVSTARRLALDPGEYNKGKAICDSPTHKGEGSAPSARLALFHRNAIDHMGSNAPVGTAKAEQG